ncbi:hypothetical protein EXIGLDRAFT_831884 [Exidia glandulosa HHB12029]|uniref:Uncharacterized protein n=1 Tax=Exidia glandulosa HHB12029 TaxID=1314781 RepID=A0A165M7Y5_EXIGL|nr:hypothetical protein EXIGLDRAFT_831884 [Exidia glandulosa HHB12029]
MSTNTLPLALRVAVRDHFDSSESGVKKALAEFHELLGAEYTLLVPWPLLRDAVPSSELDNDVFVQSVCRGLETFVRKLLKLVEAEETGFADKFLDRTQQAHRIEVKSHPDAKASTSFVRYGPEASGGVIQLFVPRVRAGYSGAGLTAFGADLVVALEGSDKNPADPASKTSFVDAGPNGNGVVAAAEVDGFVEVGVKPKVASHVPTPFPSLDAIPRPDTLLRQAPYHLILRGGGEQMSIEGHPPSLELIRDYLRHHIRQGGEPEAIIMNGPWGVAVGQLQIAYTRRYGSTPQLSTTVIISLIENVLGFERVEDVSGQGFFYWKRETPFEGI